MLQMLRDLVAHKGHANAALLNAIGSNSAAVSDPELWELLHHVLLANRFWLLTVLRLPFVFETESRHADSFTELVARYAALQAQEAHWFEAAQVIDLERILTSPLIPHGECSVAQAFVQVCMHSHGHRAQAAKMLRRHGATPPETDFILWVGRRPDAHWADALERLPRSSVRGSSGDIGNRILTQARGSAINGETEGSQRLTLLDRFASAWNRHDLEALMSMMTDDCVFQASAGAQVDGQRSEGTQAVRAAYAAVFESFPDAQWANARHFVAGDRGVSEWTFTGTRTDGKRVEVTGCDVFTFRDGKIAVKNSVPEEPPSDLTSPLCDRLSADLQADRTPGSRDRRHRWRRL